MKSIRKNKGFTLIEIILVIAITSSLVLVAFVGQGRLRGQAQFDAAVNKVIATIADAHNEASAAVNFNGAGNGISDCNNGGSVSSEYVFGGVAWVAAPDGTYRMDFYKVVPQASASYGCIFNKVTISMPAPIMVNASNPGGTQGAKELFIRSNDVLNICPVTDNTVDVEALFRAGNCPEGTLTLDITDEQGRHGQVVIDKSGLAQRKF